MIMISFIYIYLFFLKKEEEEEDEEEEEEEEGPGKEEGASVVHVLETDQFKEQLWWKVLSRRYQPFGEALALHYPGPVALK